MTLSKAASMGGPQGSIRRGAATMLGGLIAVAVAHAAMAQGQVVGWGDNAQNQLSSGTTQLLPYVQVEAGWGISAALRADGTVATWGSLGSFSQLQPPAGLGDVVQVECGWKHFGALTRDGRVLCWGDNQEGEVVVPAGLGPVKKISLGFRLSSALQFDGTVRCWGSNTNQQCNVPPDLSGVTDIAAGGVFGVMVAARQDGTVRCWGSDSNGQCSPPSDLSGVRQVAVGTLHAMALKTDGTVRVWGSGGSGEYNIPPDLNDAVQIAATGQFCLALRAGGTVACWGGGAQGQGCEIPAGTAGISQLAAGRTHSVALKADGSLVCWGSNLGGEIEPPGPTTGVVQVAAGSAYSLALLSDGTVTGWGTNNYGVTDPPLGLSNITKVAAGRGFFAMALRSTGTVTCWGSNDFGACNVPSDLSGVTDIAAGDRHAVARTASGVVRCWGSNSNPWSASPSNQSVVPQDLGTVAGIAAGAYHTIAIRTDGTVRAWGAGTFDSGNYPNVGQSVVPAGLASVVQVSAGSWHSVALKSNGAVVCWGSNGAGQSIVPDGLSGVVQVAAGASFTIALKSDGKVVGWQAPYTQVPTNLGRVTQISAGGHALALLEPGASSCGNTAGAGTATLAVSGAAWENVGIWSWSNGGSPQVPGALSNVDLGDFGSVGSLCDAQCGTLTARAGATIIVPVNLSLPSSWGNHSISVSGDATMAGRVWLVGSGASVLPSNLNVPVLVAGNPIGSFDVIQTTVPAPSGKFLSLVQDESLGGGTTYSLRLIDLPGSASLNGSQPGGFSGTAVAAEAMDWNGDGFDDLALAIDFGTNQPGRLQVLLNDGTGELGGTSVQVNTPAGPQCPAVGDVNEDGKIDAVVCIGSNQTAQVYLNAYAGTAQGTPFTEGAVLPVGGNPLSAVVIPPPSSSSLAEGPGGPSVGVGSGGNSGGGSGTSVKVFNPLTGQVQQSVAVPGSPNSLVRRGRQLGTGGNNAATIGGSDLVGFFSLLTPNAQGVYSVTQSVLVPGVPEQADAADIDGDTYVDIVTANSSPQPQGVGSATPVITLFRGNRTGIGLPVPIAPQGASAGLDVSLIDADADGVRDLVSVHATTAGKSEAVLIAIDTTGPGRPLTIGAQRELEEAERPALSTRGNLDGVGGEDLFLVDAGLGSTLLGGATGPAAVPYRGDPGPPACIGDINGDGDRDGVDLGNLLAQWGVSGSADIDSSGSVDGVDLAFLLANWGPCQ